MPRVHHVKKARKPNRVVSQEDIDNHTADNPTASYYHWKFRYGGKYYSKTYPRPSQLTQSEFLSQIYAMEEDMPSSDSFEEASDVKEYLIDLGEQIRDLGNEQEEKLYNMPDALQESETGELLRSRQERCEELADACEAAADELESLEEDADLQESIENAFQSLDWGFE